jgi:hypothetical protein
MWTIVFESMSGRIHSLPLPFAAFVALFDVSADDVAPTAALFDVLPADVRLPESVAESVIEVCLRMAMRFVGDEIDVVAAGRVFDGLNRVSFEQRAIVGVLWFLEIRRPRVVVSTVSDGFRFAVAVIVIV